MATLGTTAQVHLGSDIGGEARGAFDILVRPGQSSGLNLAETHGLVEPNYLSFAGSGGISFAQLSKIRAIPGVDVAAPISVVGQVTGAWATPLVKLPPTASSGVYTFTLTQRVSDGISNRVVSTQTFNAILPSNPAVDPASTGDGSFIGGDAKTGWILAGLPLPPVSSSVVAVDPKAEEQLIGHRVPALAQLAELRSMSAGSFTYTTLNNAVKSAVSTGRLTVSSNVQASVAPGTVGPVVPVIVTATDPSSGTLTVNASLIAQGSVVDQAISKSSAQLALSNWTFGAKPIEVKTGQAPMKLEPLQAPEITVGVGTHNGTERAGGLITQVNGLLIDRPKYQNLPDEHGVTHLKILPQGLVPMNGPKIPLLTDPDARVGEVPVSGKEQSYRLTKPVKAANTVSFYPLRSFDPSQLLPKSTAEGRVSLGAYDVPPLVVQSSSFAAKGTTIKPTLNTAGLAVREPVAIADIDDAETLRGSRPIDAIRIRVSGIKTVNEAAQARVEAVASQIASLGLSVDVVIGSSPQAVAIDVPSYVTADGALSSLGTVQQSWTTMGAATTVSRGLSQATVLLAILAALGALVAAISGQFLEGATTRRDTAILQIVGWRRRDVYRRFLTAPYVIGGLGLVAFVTIWWFTGHNVAMGLVGGALCLFVPTGATIAVMAAAQSSTSSSAKTGDARGRKSIIRAASPTSLALRRNLGTPGRSASIAGLLIVATTGFGLAYAIYASRAQLAGPTFLARSVVEALTAEHAALVVLLVVVSAVFAIVLWRYSLIQRFREDRVLSALGWQPGERRAQDVRMLGWLALPSILVGSVAAGFLSLSLQFPLPVPTLVVSLAAGLILSVLVAAIGRTVRGNEET